MNFNKYTTENPAWDIILRDIEHDIYHTRSYHRALKKENRAVLLVAERDNFKIALPLVIRAIPDSEYFDCSSVYGYCGPISNLWEKDLLLIEFFQRSLLMFLRDNKVVSVFSRLHGFLQGERFIHGLGTIRLRSKTIYFDMTEPDHIQIQQYRKSTKYDIRRLQKLGFHVRHINAKSELRVFIDMYNSNMIRLGARDSLKYDEEYFEILMSSDDFDANLFMIYKDNEPAAGGIFTVCDRIMQYHLSATSEKFLQFSPIKLAINEARIMARKLELSYFHLGGGVISEDDTLFRFKSGFSKKTSQFKVWEFIVDNEAYVHLLKRQNIHELNFFPAYRSP